MKKKETSRETVFDVDVEKLARIYAQAALDAAGSDEDEVLSELQATVTEVLDKFPDMEEVFGSALVSQDEKLGVLDRVFGSRVSTTTINFLKVLTKHDRLGMLRQVVRVAGQLWEERSNRVPVQLEMALDLDSALQAEVVSSLRSSLGIEPIVTTKINPDLIAGFVVRVGDKVYDASVKTSLERSRQAMIDRAIEAIQNQPEQFLEK
ncbi:MAG: ATP synthase F1 subunit delta [Planctomycetes bacterium]|nr:ATP synthase F1 subunit delta [Planctomycetota bacterium]